MFNKLSNILQHAVEALAPDTSLHEDFTYHWKSVTNFYIENTDDKTPVTDSNIPSHLKQMLQILIHEEEMRGPDDTGPCMEYMLQHKILETLHTLGRADCPPGMKQQVLVFFKHILGKIKQPLLPHVHVHRPVARLVRVCGEVQAAPTETEEVLFLSTVCAQLKREPHLVHFFLSKSSEPEKSMSQSTSATNSTSAESGSYDLVNSLLNLSKSEDSRVAVKACEGLLLLVSIPHEAAARTTVEDTALCPLLNSRLTSLFTSLPTLLDPSDIESLNAKWGFDSHSYTSNDARNFTGKRSLVSFLSWFDYCDTLIMEVYQSCGTYIAKSIVENFLEQTLLSPLMQADEKAALTTTAILTKLFAMVRSKELLREMNNFFVPDSGESKRSQELLVRLLERCDHMSDEMSVKTLRLFETVLSKPDATAIERLIVQPLQNRAYHAKNPGNIVLQSDSDEMEWDLEPGLEHEHENAASSPTKKVETQRPDVQKPADDNPRARVQQAVNSYLTILPDSAKSTQVQDDDSGYDGYLREAHRSYKEMCELCKGFNWPNVGGNNHLTAPERCVAVAVYVEGPFLTMLFNKLSQVLSQPYVVNLVVTSLVSRLCLLPHPLLHDFFANPLTPLRPQARSVYNVLQVLAEQVVQRIAHVTNFKTLVVSARRKLTSCTGSHRNDNEHTTPHRSAAVGGHLSSSSDQNYHQTFLEGAIVVEEFCKELAAIAFVKHHASLHMSS